MRILAWNINGIRSHNSSVRRMLQELDADIVCFQETKISRDMLDSPTAIIEGYTSYFSFCKTKSGYSGVATFCRDAVLPTDALDSLQNVDSDLGKIGRDQMLEKFDEVEIQSLDCEGRAVITEHTISYGETRKSLVVINLYCPRVDPDKAERQSFQTNYHKMIQLKAEALVASGRHVVLAGDLNVSHRKVDHCKPEENPNFEQRPSRLWLDQFLHDAHHPRETTCDNPQCTCGLPNSFPGETESSDPRKTVSLKMSEDMELSNVQMIDLFRYYWPSRKEAYTCWNSATGARKLNFGTRLDYIICDVQLPTISCDLSRDVEGSDHCPLYAVLDVSCIASNKTPACCTKFFKELAGKQSKLSDFFTRRSQDSDSMNSSQRSMPSTTSEEQDIDPVVGGKRTAKGRKAPNRQMGKKPKLTTKLTSNDGSLLSLFVVQNKKPSSGSQLIIENATTEECTVKRDTDDVQIISDPIKNDAERSEYKSLPDCTARISATSAWFELFKPPPKPKCKGHNEPCVLRTVKKGTLNKGRQFWVCAKPEGRKSDPESRCDHFEWITKSKSKPS